MDHETSSPRIVGAIPARYASTRLPGKPLRDIAGMTLIERVYRQAAKAACLDRVVVLTDDERIAAAVREFGGECEMTPGDCASGTDRIAWAASGWGARVIINIQGDEPLIEPEAIDRLGRHLLEHPEDPVATLAAPADPGDGDDPNVAKTVLDRRGYALYFSRAPIPYARGKPVSPLRHIGIYGYQHDALMKIAALEPTPLEMSESLEQLRMLEAGIPLRVLTVDHAWPGVDTLEDLQRVEALLAQSGSGAEPR